MESSNDQDQDDLKQVKKFLAGDREALGLLYEKYQPVLLATLAARGAGREDAEDVAARIWERCLVDDDEQPSLLTKFNGRCSLHGWLRTVATNLWFDWRRREKGKVNLRRPPESDRDPFDTVPAPAAPAEESDLSRLLHASLVDAFAECDARQFVALHLVYLHSFTQREVGQVLSWNEPKASREMKDVLDGVLSATLQKVWQKDPRLQLSTDDFLELCDIYRIA